MLDEGGLAQHFGLALWTEEEVGRSEPARDTRACECLLQRFRFRRCREGGLKSTLDRVHD